MPEQLEHAFDIGGLDLGVAKPAGYPAHRGRAVGCRSDMGVARAEPMQTEPAARAVTASLVALGLPIIHGTVP